MITNVIRSLGAFATTACLIAAQCPPPGGGGYGSPPPPPARGGIYVGPGDMVGPGTPRAPAPEAPAPLAPLAPRPQAAGPVAMQPQPPRTARPPAPQMAAPQQPTNSPHQVLARFGAPVAFSRERTSRARLTWDWDYAKVVQAVAAGETVARSRSHALPFDEAVQKIADGDPRPLLVMRECFLCGSDEESDIGRKLLNEKTVILARWFHCVRVSDAVRAPNHPLHNLFTGERSPHLVLCARDGSGLTPVFGEEPLSAVWQKMRGLLEGAYEGDIHAATDTLLQTLSRFDYVDAMEAEVASRLDAVERSAGHDIAKVARMREQLAALALERRTAERNEARALDLRLRGKRG